MSDRKARYYVEGVTRHYPREPHWEPIEGPMTKAEARRFAKNEVSLSQYGFRTLRAVKYQNGARTIIATYTL